MRKYKGNHGSRTTRRFRRKGIRWAVAGLLGPIVLLLAIDLLFPLRVDRLRPPSSTVVLDRNGELMRVFLAPDEMWRISVEAVEVAPVMRRAVTAYEDRWFYYHPGVDPVAVVRAALANLRAGRVEQGGSTITMQLARLIDPKERTLVHKLVEAFRALQLEVHYSKEEILTFYLNHVPYGGNVVGVGAASYLYFGKHPSQLTLGEAALLAAIPNNPNAYRPDLRPSAAAGARAKVLRILEEQGLITAGEHREARTEPIPRRRFDLPFVAPHVGTHLKTRYGSTERLETTLDASLQRQAERMLADHLRPLLARGITNGAIVVLDNASNDVLALVGSRAFFEEAHQGQVNGATAPRSPGSALKPFVYALALDGGLVSPQRLVFDVPVDYSGYRPENYDRTYNGMIAVDEALVRSLNVPAVNLSARLGGYGLYHSLKKAGVTTLTEAPHHYGLALVLGGGEVTLLELTSLYAGLAQRGRFRPYRLLKAEPESEGEQLLQPGTTYIVAEILSRLRRPELPAVWEWSRDMPKVAWKTGTSYGHRDAWSVGFTPRYTVGVWVGNMDGQGAPALVGAEIAAPLMFSLFKLVETGEQRWFHQPPDVERRRVCSLSGMPATPNCPSTREELFIPGRSPVQPCHMHRIILVDDKTGHRLCSRCKLGRSFHERHVTQWPAEVAVWLEQHGYPIDAIPEHSPWCERITAGAPPVIRSPRANAAFRLRTGVPVEHQQILLEASTTNATSRIFWFVDGELIHEGDPAERVFLTPEPGTHVILCMDDEGRSSEVRITVQ